MIADYEKEQREVKQFILDSESEVQTAKEEAVDLKIFLENIRKCTDITELTPTLVNTLIKKIEVFNSVVGADGKKHVPITIHFRAAGIITIPDEKEIIAAMEEIRNGASNVA
jgi:site-specific DNA recombinase